VFAYTIAQNLYDQVHSQGRWGQLWSKLTGRARRLLNLDEVIATCGVYTRSNGRLQTVSIAQIRGSEGRSRDFDGDFNPLQGSDKDRWISIALARYYDKPLPAVHLIQVGDIYFVRDGHHRISVAQAMGQQEIDAEVTVWQWQQPPEAAQRRVSPAAGPARLLIINLSQLIRI
jgi:hypothetical protein